MYEKLKESDWKVFRDMLPGLREKYLKKKNKEIQEILKDPEKNETERFWDAEEKIKQEVKILRECLDDYSRSKMDMKVMLMCRYGMLEKKDLEKFSEEFQDQYQEVWNRWNT
jgi:hypothetical protein